MAYWVLGLIALGVLFIAYPVLALLPRGREKEVMRLRNRATRQGLHVAFPTETRADGQKVYVRFQGGDRAVEYQWLLPDGGHRANWRFLADPSNDRIWRLDWPQGGPSSRTLEARLQHWAEQWDSGVDGRLRLEQRGLTLLARWDERGSEQSVDKIVAGLRDVQGVLVTAEGAAAAKESATQEH